MSSTPTSKKKTCTILSHWLYFATGHRLQRLEPTRTFLMGGIAGGRRSLVGTPSIPSFSDKDLRNRMNSVLLVTTVVASLGVGLGLAAVFLRIAFKLLGRSLAK